MGELAYAVGAIIGTGIGIALTVATIAIIGLIGWAIGKGLWKIVKLIKAW
jgi:hypothetical protein